MTRIVFILILSLIILSADSLAGVSVVGTRFIITQNTKSLPIKIINDNENDYLVKTNISGNDEGRFVVTPPLFLLAKNTSNIQMLIPDKIENIKVDQLYSLTIAFIPNSRKMKDLSTISLALRSHFNLIYRHDNLSKFDPSLLALVKESNDIFWLRNLSNFVLTINIKDSNTEKLDSRITLIPEGKVNVSKFCKLKKCNFWVFVVDDDDSILKKIHMNNFNS